MRSLLRILPYLTRHRWPFWGGNAGLLGARVFEALIPIFLMIGLDRIASRPPEGAVDVAAALAGPALGIAACVALRFALIVGCRRLVRRVGVAVAYDLRKRVYAHLQRQGPAFFALHSTGDLMARAVNDIQLVRQLIGQGSRTVLVLGFSAIVALGFMLSLAPGLTALLVLPLPVVAGVGYVLARRVYAQSIAVQEGFSTLSERVQENLGGIRTVQALGQEEAEIARFDEVNGDYADCYFELMRTNSLLAAWMPALVAAATLIILGAGGSAVLRGELSVGTFAAFFWYMGMLLWPVREAGNMVNLFQRGAAGAARLHEVLDHPPEIEERPRLSPSGGVAGAIQVDDLVYTYPGARIPALEKIRLEIAPGETVALVGRIGSGKSTLLRALVRMLDPDSGSVRLDGVDVADYPLASLRSAVALVPQDTFLFADTLHHNLAYDDPERSAEQVRDASEAADLLETVERLPDQFETLVGERGVTLSGGQKQRATLARGLIRKSPVLLLDDCFSSVDTETEEHILRRLRAWRAGLTTVLVSHRVSTVRHADRIYVLDAGRLTEQGSHAELVAQGGFYARLDQAQRRREVLLERLPGGPRA